MAHYTDAWITNSKLESSTKSTHPQPARMLEVVADTETKINHDADHDNADWAANDDDDDDDHDGLVLDNPIEIEVEDDEPREGFASNNLLVMDAMMMIMIAEEEERTADLPGIIQEKAMDVDEDEKNGEAKDDGDVDDHGATRNVRNRRGGRIAPPPPPLRAHHAGEIVRTWMHDGTAAARFRPTPKAPFPLPEHRQRPFAGDGIRAWLAMD